MYEIEGFLSSGTYGRVFKASLNHQTFAIKRFKPDKDSVGVSLSACREIKICKEVQHPHVVDLFDILLDPSDRSISLVFEYAEHDFLVYLYTYK